jgi:rare lipoprotein A
MINKIYIVITTLIASVMTASFSFEKFDASKSYTKIVQDTVKPDSTLALIDSLSIEEGLYNYKLYKSNAHASYYANKFNGKRTASGERFDNNKLTAAHRKLAFGTKVRITNIRNGKSIIVKVNDRGPYSRGREIDLSRKAFMFLATNKGSGEMRVKIEIAQKK